MGTYVYTLRNRTVNVNVDGEFRPVYRMEYAFRDLERWREYPGWAKAFLTRANNLWDRLGRRPQVILWNDHVWVTRSPSYSDWAGDGPGVCIGRVVKVGNRWHCVAQETTVDLVLASWGFDTAPDKEESYAV